MPQRKKKIKWEQNLTVGIIYPREKFCQHIISKIICGFLWVTCKGNQFTIFYGNEISRSTTKTSLSTGNKMIQVECGMLNPNKTLILEKESQPRWMQTCVKKNLPHLWQKPRLVAPLKEGHIHTLFCMSSCQQVSLVFALSPKFS